MERLGTAKPSARDNVTQLIEGLGPAMRRLRRARGLTLETLADAVGTSVAHLSRLESGDRQPSLEALLRIAAALGVAVDELLVAPQEPGPGTVVRGASAPYFAGEGFRFQPLCPEAGPDGLTAVKIVFPVERTEGEYKTHEGEEWIYVLSGRLRLTLGGERTVLEPGDAAYFNGLLPHRWAVLGDENVEMLMVGCTAATASGIPQALRQHRASGHHLRAEPPPADTGAAGRSRAGGGETGSHEG